MFQTKVSNTPAIKEKSQKQIEQTQRYMFDLFNACWPPLPNGKDIVELPKGKPCYFPKVGM